MNDALDRLARHAGIEPSFHDYYGRETLVSDQTKRALLEAMGYDLESHAGAECFLAPALAHGRIWAIATQLYALRSQRNWGIGDFTDLATLGVIAGRAGARAIGLNPLHELHPHNPGATSPYAPSSRLFLNTLYVDVGAVPELAQVSRARALAGSREFRHRIASLRSSDLVDYAGVARAKREVLELCFDGLLAMRRSDPQHPRVRAFRTFRQTRGAALERLALYQALAEHFAGADRQSYGWLQWPSAYRCADSYAVAQFAAERRERIEFYAYLQWLADEQLAAAARACDENGVWLYRDLAVGADANGADAWADPHTLVTGASLGAPPDALNALGQNWGLPPLSPIALQAQGLEPFHALLRANMRHAGVLRIDHVMALARAFWIPRGRPALEGAYVRYPFDAMIAALAGESRAHRCMVVGEDLGTVPEGFRDRMRAAKVLSTRLLYFERNWEDGGFLAPEAYPCLAAAAVGTHDLPPLAGWWLGEDVAVRARIGLYPDAGAAESERGRARFMLVDALERSGAAAPARAARLRADAERGGTQAACAELVAAVHAYLALTPCMLVVVQLEDVLGQIDAVNVPGTWHQHPNWRRKYRATLEELSSDGRLAETGKMLAAQ